MKSTLKVGAVFFLGAFLFTSCKKDWNCVCKGESEYKIINQTKSKARKVCEDKVQIGFISASGNDCYISKI